MSQKLIKQSENIFKCYNLSNTRGLIRMFVHNMIITHEGSFITLSSFGNYSIQNVTVVTNLGVANL